MSKKLRVAFVVQRCGTEVNGGAEALCLMVATHMAAAWDVDILTTCALDYMTWSNHYPPGEELLHGVTIRRFPVTHERDVASFNRLSAEIASRVRTAPIPEQETWMRAQGPVSDGLIQYIGDNVDEYDLFVFCTYLYAQTYFGLPAVRRKAVLAPFAHDEWPIYMTMWDEFFRLPRAMIFNTIEERKFLLRRFPHAQLEGEIVGVGIDEPESIDGDRFRQKYNIPGPFMLYLGRIDEAKNSPLLFDYFMRLKRGGRSDLHLVLIGRSQIPVPVHPHIHELGFVSEQDKWDAIAASRFLVNPSGLESLSLVLLEAWLAGRPVLVNAAADVLVGQCRRANGGMWFANFEEFESEVAMMETPVAARLGSSGRRYVERHYRWERIVAQYESLALRVGAVPR